MQPRFTRPGSLEFLFGNHDSLEVLMQRLQSGKRWQIIGPHGTGKTTLLKTLMTQIETGLPNFRPCCYSLHDGQKKLPANQKERASWNEQTLLIVDGYEQLGWLERWRLQRRAQRQRFTFLITTHTDQGWPTLFQTTFDMSVLHSIIEELSPGFSVKFAPEIQTAITGNTENIREVLFELYDVWNRKVKTSQA